jgi:hypothetical protein
MWHPELFDPDFIQYPDQGLSDQGHDRRNQKIADEIEEIPDKETNGGQTQEQEQEFVFLIELFHRFTKSSLSGRGFWIEGNERISGALFRKWS